MPRTSYGDKKRNQAWQLVESLMLRQGTQGVQSHQNNKKQFYLLVEASLSNLAAWSKLTIEGVREAINEHLGEKFLGIVIDHRTQKSGRGAEQWKFELKLWSTDLTNNKQKFYEVWDKAKSHPSPQAEDIKLFQKVRESYCQKILIQHSKMRFLNGNEVEVDQLYVDVWLLDPLPCIFHISRYDLSQTFDLRNDRIGLGNRIRREFGFSVVNEKAKLLILGKPGSGKTTFLKHLAVEWCKGKFQPNMMAVFIEFRRIQHEQPQLLDVISKQLNLSDQDLVKVLLERGELLMLMDGLDELRTSELRREVREQLQQIVENYPKNRFILTCRTKIFESIPAGFTPVEVADFDIRQVKQFVENWFKAGTGAEATQQYEKFERAIKENQALKELTVTPVLLSLMCLVLEHTGKMASDLALLYQKGINLLLSKWNDNKDINGWELGSQTYRKLSVEQKQNLLAEIAARKFENPKNFVLFEQEEIVLQITKYLKLTDSNEGIAVLKAIEAQHGLLIERADELWSFSHLTFQEHFTVKWLIQLPSEQLAKKITNPQWQEVVKKLVESQQPVEKLLHMIELAINTFISKELNLQKILTWVLEQSESIQANYKPASVRCYYFQVTLIICRAHILDCNIDRPISFDFARFLNDELVIASKSLLGNAIDPELAKKLEQLKETLSLYPIQNFVIFQKWWQTNGTGWLKQFYQVCNISHDWQLTNEEAEKLICFYNVNQFLIELMKIAGSANNTICVEIENDLFLPWAELQRRDLNRYVNA